MTRGKSADGFMDVRHNGREGQLMKPSPLQQAIEQQFESTFQGVLPPMQAHVVMPDQLDEIIVTFVHFMNRERHKAEGYPAAEHVVDQVGGW